jgi:hypothetical protein
MLSVTGQRGLWAAKIEGAASFLDSSMAEALAEFEGGGEALAGKLALAEPQVSETAKVETLRVPSGRNGRRSSLSQGLLSHFQGESEFLVASFFK